MLNIDISSFIKQHHLPDNYQQLSERWFIPLAEEIAMHQKGANEPLLIGINGAQGSGKSTLADFLVFVLREHFKLNTIALSIDDFYLTRQQRQHLAETVHPLLLTRGVPGTHDTQLAYQVITDLKAGRLPVNLPRFNKAVDDRAAETEQITQPLDIIIFEGWCLGSEPQAASELTTPVNELEREEDADGRWREYVNQQLAGAYQTLFNLVDVWVMFKAPAFDCVFNWRLEQENKLREKAGAQQHVMDAAQVARFIQFYQRVTENTLKTLPKKVHVLYEVDAKRKIIHMSSKPLTINNMHTKQWLVFTDMDGSLLDHYTYQFDDAIPTLNKLAQQQIPVIPITSKTQAELELLRTILDNQHPFIIENGAAVFIPKGYFETQPEDTVAQGDYWVKAFVEPRATWQALIEKVSAYYEGQFTTFAEAGISGIIEMTGLDEASAALAAQRQYGEPIAWRGDAEKKQQFIADLTALGANVLVGGRFMHVSGLSDKGVALKWLKQVYQQQMPNKQVETLALGDSNNDKAMLETADYAVLIRSPVHDLPLVNRVDGLFISTYTGPQGWAEGVNKHIATL